LLAERLHCPDLTLSVTVERARVPDGDLDSAFAAFKKHEERAKHCTRMEARYHLWELTHDKTHLIEAKRLLDFAVEHSPEEYRSSMLENVPLHRDIMKAWAEHGASD
jgi:hypothetical protein